MANHLSNSISTLIRTTKAQAIFIVVLMAIALTFVLGFVRYYEQKRQNIQQVSELLASTASMIDGGAVVARQVRLILEEDPSVQSIVFYGTEKPVADFDQAYIERSRQDWYNALFASSISFNRAVTSHDLAQALPSPSEPQSKVKAVSERSALIGYINITLDINQMRLQWLKNNLGFWLIIVAIGLGLIAIVTRKLAWPAKDLDKLSKICKSVSDDPKLNQLPAIQQRFEFSELVTIRQAFISVFNRLRLAQEHIEALAAFEAQLHSKGASLDVQRHNFQSMITHELKTSLNAITGGLQLIQLQALNDEQKDIWEMIHKGSQHLHSTLEQIIQLNKIEKGQISINLSPFNPLQLLADLIAEFDSAASAKGLTLTSRIYHIDYTLEGDVQKIHQVLSSLLDNAIKFTLEGEIAIESQLTHFNDNIRWQIKIIDSGIGIDNKYIDDIFTPFFQVDPSLTREFEGAGIGLPVIKQIIQLIGASLEVKSDFGVGSTFTVVLPLRNIYPSQRQTLLAKKSILYYYQDDPSVLVGKLRDLGASVDCHQHELAIIEQLKANDFDLVMIAEDIQPDLAAKLTQLVRQQESEHRSLIVYWYPSHQKFAVDDLKDKLYALGVDFCHETPKDLKGFKPLIERWFG